MNHHLIKIKQEVYDKCGLRISDFIPEQESKEYDACQFDLNGRKVISRTAKITPKKSGQFVTFWKRHGNGPIEPFRETDSFDFYSVQLQKDDKLGQFIFPKSILIKKGIVSTNRKEGKRAFRVYPSWDRPTSAQAERTQKWQLNYFYEVNDSTDLAKVMELYQSTVKQKI